MPKAMGTFPLSDDYEISISRLVQSFIILLIGAITTVTFPTIRHLGSVVDVYAYYSQLGVLCVSFLLNIVWLISKRDILKSLSDGLNVVEEYMKLANIAWTYRTSLFQINLNIVVVTTFALIYLFSNVMDNTKILFVVRFLFTYPPICSILNQFLGLLYVLRYIMQRLLETDCSCTIVVLNEKLLTLCDQVIECFGAQMLFLVGSTFVAEILTLYSCLHTQNCLSTNFVIWYIFLMYPSLHIIASIRNIIKKVYIKIIIIKHFLKLILNITFIFVLFDKRSYCATSRNLFFLGKFLNDEVFISMKILINNIFTVSPQPLVNYVISLNI